MRIHLSLTFLSLCCLAGCFLSNQADDIKVLCGVSNVNRDLSYVRIVNTDGNILNSQQLATLSADFIHSDGRTESLSPSTQGCFALPKAKGNLSARLSSNPQMVAYAADLLASGDRLFRDLPLTVRGQLDIQMPCPKLGFIANEILSDALVVNSQSSNLQNLLVALSVTDKSGTSLGTLFQKDFGSWNFNLPSKVSLAALPEGEYSVQLSVRDSFFGSNPKSLLMTEQCPLLVKRSCRSESENFDTESLSCKPKLCEAKYKVGEYWSDDLSNKNGKGLFNCQLQAGKATKVSTDATCKPGFFETHGSCIGAKKLAAGYNHTCALLENGEVSCWGYNVFGTLGISQSLANSGEVMGPQAPVGLAEQAIEVAVGTVSSCALLESKRVQCWGLLPNALDEKGLVKYQVFDNPQFIRMANGNDLDEVKSIAMGGGPDHDTMCALTSRNEAFCWGKDLFSRHNSIQFGSWLFPKRIFIEHSLQQVVLTDRDICGVDLKGAITCQGSALGADLSKIFDDSVSEPILVDLPPTRELFSKSRVKCALLTDDRFYCWDLRTDSQDPAQFTFSFGFPDIRRVMTSPIEKIEFFQKLESAGLNAEISCYLDKANKPSCQLGAPSSGGPIMEILKENGEALSDITTISVGFWHGCGVHLSGQVFCWGDNQFGRLGNGTIGESGDNSGIPRFVRATLIQSP